MKFFTTRLLIASLVSGSSYALPISPCKEDIIKHYTNLGQAQFQDKDYIKTNLNNLLAPEITDAYALSLPLLVSAQLGDTVLYSQSLTRMNKAMAQVEDGPFKAWLYGRMVFAAHSIHDEVTKTQTAATLNALVDNLKKVDSTRLDRFTIWSLGYTAALSKTDLDNTKSLLVAGGDHLTNQYLTTLSSGASEEIIQGARSDALWAWVLTLQAAANAGDDELYRYSVEQMQMITKQSSLAQSLVKGLLRTAASNDYPAWALGIASVSSQANESTYQYMELQKVLTTSIAEAKQGNKLAEALLALVNEHLATAREEAMQHPRARL